MLIQCLLSILVFSFVTFDAEASATTCTSGITTPSLKTITCTADVDQCKGASCTPSPEPIGGLKNYLHTVPASRATCTARQVSELLVCLAQARPGDVVYIPDGVSLDLSNEGAILIPDGITLAGSRGINGSLGALIHVEKEAADTTKDNVFKIQGPNVRITGLRFRGPQPKVLIYDATNLFDHTRTGIIVDATITGVNSYVEIDNNEFYQWHHSGVRVEKALNVWIHHNTIHHNRRRNLGYGVSVIHGSALIENNVFFKNRHDIAGAGHPGSSYTARYNIVQRGGNLHNFDMHGGADRGDCTNIAGQSIHIHHNTFLERAFPSIAIRGIPIDGACIHNNVFPHAGSDGDAIADNTSKAIRQANALGNIKALSDSYGTGFREGLSISDQGRDYYDFLNWNITNRSELRAVRVGDFNGDGKDDLFRVSSEGVWEVSLSATGEFTPWGSSTVAIENFAIGDFNGDGKADIFYADGTRWQVAYSQGSRFSTWQFLVNSGYKTSDLAIGDFNGDGCSDFFRAGVDSAVSYSVGPNCYRRDRQPWQNLGDLGPLSGLRFGDFTGQGRTQILRNQNGYWEVANAVSPIHFSSLMKSEYAMDRLVVGDFDGDGKDDLMKSDGNWFFSTGAAALWAPLLNSTIALIDILVGDFNGDGKADVLVVR